jgi:hypothetical protein
VGLLIRELQLILERQTACTMQPDAQLRRLWEDGVALGSAWWVYAVLQKKKKFRELQQTAALDDPAPHMGFRQELEDEVINRLSTGELRAFGIEYGSTGRPVAIPKNYFWKGTEIDFDNDAVTALGRKFGQVTVLGDREPLVENLPGAGEVDLKRILAEQDAPALPDRLADRIMSPASAMSTKQLPSEASHQIASEAARGRPSKTSEIEEAINILLDRNIDLTSMPRPAAYRAIKECAEIELKSNTQIGFSDPVIQRALFRRFGRRR